MWKSVRFKCSANTPWKDVFVCRLRIQKDDSPLNPYMFVSYDGTVISEEDMKVVSTCKMDVHKFPFDTQRCNITIGSAIHYGEGGVYLCGMFTDSVVMFFFFLLSPQLTKFSSFLSPTRLGPRSFPERWWRRRESGSSSNYPSPAPISPSTIDSGNSSYTRYATQGQIQMGAMLVFPLTYHTPIYSCFKSQEKQK